MKMEKYKDLTELLLQNQDLGLDKYQIFSSPFKNKLPDKMIREHYQLFLKYSEDRYFSKLWNLTPSDWWRHYQSELKRQYELSR
jgi:hypothetical protein